MVMFDDLCLDHINHVFGNVGGMVADALQIAGDQQKRHGAGSGLLIFSQVIIHQLIRYAVAQLIGLGISQ